MDKVELVTNALRDALVAYEKLDGPDCALVIVGDGERRAGPHPWSRRQHRDDHCDVDGRHASHV